MLLLVMGKALSLRSYSWNKLKNLPHQMNGLASLVSDSSLMPVIDDWYLGIFRSLPSRPWSTPEPSSPTTSLLPRRERQPLRPPQLPLAPTWQDSTTRRQRPLNQPCPPHRYVQWHDVHNVDISLYRQSRTNLTIFGYFQRPKASV